MVALRGGAEEKGNLPEERAGAQGGIDNFFVFRNNINRSPADKVHLVAYLTLDHHIVSRRKDNRLQVQDNVFNKLFRRPLKEGVPSE